MKWAIFVYYVPKLRGVKELVADDKLDVVVVSEGRLQRLHRVDGGRGTVGDTQGGCCYWC